MALCHFLAHHFEQAGLSKIHAVTVDHGLRPGSDKEAENVKKQLESLPHVQPAVLRITADFAGTRIQEQARDERYKLMSAYCSENVIQILLTAHHMDDQAETLLFRLAKGSGLDGLGAMASAKNLGEDGLLLLRPFLDIPKDDLITYCHHNNIDYVKDPTNQNENFARPRLRAAKEVLEGEGLTAKRLAVTARRVSRARDALDKIAGEALRDIMLEGTKDRFVLKYAQLADYPQEIRLRVLLSVMGALVPNSPYRPRLEKVENLEEKLFAARDFRTQTLGKCIFLLDKQKGEEGAKLTITREKARNI